MMQKDIMDYYSRDDVQQAILRVAKDREVVGVFSSGSFDKRPNTIQYPQDIASMIRQGVVEFHCSLERWSRPMALRQDNYSTLRKGWDLVLDLDCRVFEHGKIAAIVISKALEAHGISGYSVKFTGGTGFHVGIPWESLPSDVNYVPITNQYPGLARQIAEYLKDFVRDDLERELLKRLGTPERIAEQMKVPLGDIIRTRGKGRKSKDGNDIDMMDPFEVVDVDHVLISPRHLFRMPYSLNRKSNLVSLPLKPGKLGSFEKWMAKPERVKPDMGFLDQGKAGEAEGLVGEAVDWQSRKDITKKSRKHAAIGPRDRLEKETFPPCINNIFKGVSDGKKRSLFILTNFLSSAGWSVDDMERLLIDWNQKNRPALRDNYIRMHVRWFQGRMRAGMKKMPPPGCSKDGYYAAIGVCKPDNACGGDRKTIRNPLNYAVKKADAKKSKGNAKVKSKRKKAEKPVYI